jgi:transcriptional regulator with XRE-family HTH domain
MSDRFARYRRRPREKQVVPRFKGPRFQPTFIRKWRKYRRLTQEQLAERVGMSPGNLSNIETGKQPYNQEHLEPIAVALGCEVVDLLIRDPTEPDSIWTIWERAKPAQRKQIVEVAKVLMQTAAVSETTEIGR